jgi:hypothetical protein
LFGRQQADCNVPLQIAAPAIAGDQPPECRQPRRGDPARGTEMPVAGSRQAEFFDPLERDVLAMNGVPTVHRQFIQGGVFVSVDGRQLAQDVRAGR